jgi:hypothetical protein
MPSIMLTEEQVKVFLQSAGAVELRDSSGRLIARAVQVSQWSEEEIAAARRSLASDKPRYSSAKVQAFLARLTEIHESEGVDEEKLRSLLARFKAGESI